MDAVTKMSAGTVHTRACLILASGFALGSLVIRDPDGLQYVAGALTGILVSPDCDVDGKFIGYTYIKKRVGLWAEFIWSQVWYMYRKSVKHGSELSHFPGIGTLGRLAYLFLFVIVFPSVLIHVFNPVRIPLEIRWWFDLVTQYWKVWLGLAFADTIHWALDICTTEHKNGNRMGLPRVRRNLRQT